MIMDISFLWTTEAPNPCTRNTKVEKERIRVGLYPVDC